MTRRIGRTIATAAMFACLGGANAAWAAEPENPWQSAPSSAQPGAEFILDQDAIEDELDGAPREGTRAASESQVRVSIPRPDGTLEEFQVVESSVMEPGLAARHPEIKTYFGRAVADPLRTIRLDTSPLGLHATVQGDGATHALEPSEPGSAEHVAHYPRVTPGSPEQELEDAITTDAAHAVATGDDGGKKVDLRVYRLALISDHTFAAAVRDPDAPAGTGFRTTAAKVALVNRVNAVLEREWAARLVLVDATDATNLDTAALSSTAGGPCGDVPCFTASQLDGCDVGALEANPVVAGLLVGARNFDIGHLLLGAGSPHGIAALPSVGLPSKARACTSSGSSPVALYAFSMVFAHEIGHQFGGDHTWSFCNGAHNQSPASGVEPGGGVTILGYPYLCGPDSYQFSFEPFYSQRSLAQFQATAAVTHAPRASVQLLRLRDFGAGDSYRLTYGGGTSAPITTANHNASGIKAAIQGISGWPTGATVSVSSVSADQALITFGGTLGSVQPRMLGVTDTVGTSLIVGERVAGGVPTNGGHEVETDNHHPVVSAPVAATIPVRTPFALSAQGSDSDGDVVTYMWEQTDGSQNGTGSVTDTARARGPLFSVFGVQSHLLGALSDSDEASALGYPSLTPTRSFPDVSQVVADSTNAKDGTCPTEAHTRTFACRAEVLPSDSYVGTRDDGTMGFRVTARDNRLGAGGTAYADTKVTIDATAGPFRVTSPTASTPVEAGKALPVTWDVAGTDKLADKLNIRLSLDAGRTFPVTLADATANDGSEEVVIPADALTWRGVLKVEAAGGAWFDVAHTLLVTRANRAPVAADDTVTLAEDTPTRVDTSANDTDEDGDALLPRVVDRPSNGLLTRAPDGTFVYTPKADFHGQDSFTYRASDAGPAAAVGTVDFTNGRTSQIATVNISVSAVNDAPRSRADSLVTDEDEPVEMSEPGVLANDSDVEGDTLTAKVDTLPRHGTLTLSTDGSLRYTPAVNYHGTDRFTYTASDAQATTSPIPVEITVLEVNDAPSGFADEFATDEDTPLESAAPGVLGNDTDIDGDKLTATVATAPQHGTLTLNADGSVRYTPAADYHGSDGFTYTVSDGKLTSSPVPVGIAVRPVNDPPVVSVTAGRCSGDIGSGSFALTLRDVDDPVAELTVSVTSDNENLLPPTGIKISGDGGARTLQLTIGNKGVGVATATIRASDGEAAAETPITVVAGGNSDDTVDGTDGPDLLIGLNGDDNVNGLAGTDLLCGGNGDDTLSGGSGADGFSGGRGVDTATDFAWLEGDHDDGTIP